VRSGGKQRCFRHCERKRSNQCEAGKLDCFVAVAPLRKRFAFVAGKDDEPMPCRTARAASYSPQCFDNEG
jgi:hypothetical protein